MAGCHLVGAYDDAALLADLASRCDVVTYEFENVPEAAVAALVELVPVRPDGRALSTAQDRLVEKTFLTDIGIPIAPFLAVDSQADLVDAVARLGGRAVVKTRRLGYDGKGQARVDTVSGDPLPDDLYASLGSVPLVAEGLVDFVAEVSVIVVRSAVGEVRCYDPVRNVHGDGILRTSTVPAAVAEPTTDAALDAARRLVEALDYVGVLGLELFVLDDGSVLANEFAPRVHNSGHWTEAACVVSQFEQHVRAVSGLPLGSTHRWADASMTNLIGDDIDTVPLLLAEPDAMVHVYGKSESRPGRKMGHVTRTTPRPPAATTRSRP